MTGVQSFHLSGRWSDLGHDRLDKQALAAGNDFRHPQFRRSVFLRFYCYHLAYRTHPGCVYFLIPYLMGDDERTEESRLWFCFLNGLTQNPVTTTIIFRRFSEVPRDDETMDQLDAWFNENWALLPFDTDRRYQKRDFPKAVMSYRLALNGQLQGDFFRSHLKATPEESFDAFWKVVDTQFVSFGRLSTWSYLEYLFIAGFDLEPSSMMLKDKSGSKSHRNGLAMVLGRDDLDWRKDSAFQGDYMPHVMDWLTVEADALLDSAKAKAEQLNIQYDRLPQIDLRHVSRFTLESALCTYKGWHRKNRRYPNVYADMLHDRIKQVQRLWPEEDLQVFWDARQWRLPEHLRLEDNPRDPGLVAQKQNHYRLTGQVIMMDHEWPVFRNDQTWMKP